MGLFGKKQRPGIPIEEGYRFDHVTIPALRLIPYTSRFVSATDLDFDLVASSRAAYLDAVVVGTWENILDAAAAIYPNSDDDGDLGAFAQSVYDALTFAHEDDKLDAVEAIRWGTFIGLVALGKEALDVGLRGDLFEVHVNDALCKTVEKRVRETGHRTLTFFVTESAYLLGHLGVSSPERVEFTSQVLTTLAIANGEKLSVK